MASELPGSWTFCASTFNWAPEVIAARRTAQEIVADIADTTVKTIELEPGLVWRSFPSPEGGEVDGLRESLAAKGGRISIVGASLDDFTPPAHPRSLQERLDFLVPQLQAAHRVGASGVRLPIGQAGSELLTLVQPLLHELDLVLYEEIQGQQAPGSPAVEPALEVIAGLTDDRVRVLVDISMLMPALPVTYLEELRQGGIATELMARLENEWLDPATHEAVTALLRSGNVPPRIHTLYMNLLIRFGRSDASDLQDILPLVGAFHLKFWDLDDDGGRVSRPLRDLGGLLCRNGFSGTLTSEWGGHEWLQDDPTEMTRSHLALAGAALADTVPAAQNLGG
ncbi:restriction endonuclease subunit R [Pseudarthrobacter phenanthrenivorans]|uniref:Restriction endonuclease subunit R n=1 Tax=Pseudarthrobacter phenanthrenivorans TaxID=361575 RepID=A0A3B0FPG0_PSEPS|nr:restriction endonuclease subunit R [Pseudarthrobacter phenanthrenivorans]RKO23461.1 restriction endonuclease subunit R [Pseudarthrobacter phenanthrenivorans]TPV50997.1 restriction endonuclease subunit R [Pseudarthrobacter phenanthrenivorans]